MHLRYYTDEKGQRVYTLKMKLDNARFSPDDKLSEERMTLKARFGLLPTQMKQKSL